MAKGLAMSDVYIALIHKEPESGYGVSFPDVPGITTVADTLDEALSEAAVALELAFEDWEGERPRQRTLDELRADPEFREWSADAVVAAVRPASTMPEAAE
jgi:predicted RNase H-like HicB family nuclease